VPNVTANGIHLQYTERGSGDPLILLMGLGATGSRWEDHVAAYQRHFRCLLIDNRGAGASDCPPGAYTTRSKLSVPPVVCMTPLTGWAVGRNRRGIFPRTGEAPGTESRINGARRVRRGTIVRLIHDAIQALSGIDIFVSNAG
jgi:pimeloyl-ACP methyl ester carboxylesterase